MTRRSLSCLALFAPMALAGFVAPASAQGVTMFDAPPPLELLRSIMVPESKPGLTRRIVIPRPELPPEARPVKPAAATMPMPEPAAPPPAPMPAPIETSAPARAAGAAAPSEAPKPGVVGFRINFAFDSDTVAPAYRGFVDRIGELMKSEPQIRLRIEGHTDAVGSDAYNRDLSVRRAVAVGEYLVGAMGIDPKRLVIVGKGKSEPITADPYDAKNRRVQFARVD